MNRDDIIRMAQEACGDPAWDGGVDWVWGEVERFANLVAAAEREKVARWQIGSGYTTGHGETIEDLLVELEWQVRESEREACAKVCDELVIHAKANGDNDAMFAAVSCATAIRIRENNGQT